MILSYRPSEKWNVMLDKVTLTLGCLEVHLLRARRLRRVPVVTTVSVSIRVLSIAPTARPKEVQRRVPCTTGDEIQRGRSQLHKN